VIAGNITNASPNDLNFAGGAGTIFGTLTGFGGMVGTITNPQSKVNFTADNQLNDNVDGGGTGTVSASAGVLQVNNAININGNYHEAADATLLIGVRDTASAAGALSDVGYGRLVVTGSAAIEPQASVTLQKTAAYAFAAGQRFVVVDATGALTNYNADKLVCTVANTTGLVANGSVVSLVNGHADLAVGLTKLAIS
jgi:hypothetical protein